MSDVVRRHLVQTEPNQTVTRQLRVAAQVGKEPVSDVTETTFCYRHAAAIYTTPPSPQGVNVVNRCIGVLNELLMVGTPAWA